MIKGVTFDLGGTLVDRRMDWGAYGERVAEYLSGLGFRVSERAFWRAVEAALEKLRARQARYREMSFEEFYGLILSSLGIRPSEELISDIKRIYKSCLSLTTYPGTREVVEELSKRYVLGAISNAVGPWPRVFLELEGLERFFKAIIISGEVGWRKPHKRPFELALRQMGLRPEEAVHVGDSPTEDIAGAKSVGMKAILVIRPGHEPSDWDIEPDAIARSLHELVGLIRALDS